MLKGDSIRVKAEDLHSVCGELLAEYLKEMGETADKALAEYANDLKNLVAQRSPKRVLKGNKQYSQGWRVSKDSVLEKNTYTIHNVNKPGLTHILEKGTDARQTSKKWNRGKADPRPHIEQAYEYTAQAFVEKIKIELSK